MAETADDIRDVLVEAGRTQVAAFSAAVGFWSAWAESASTYSRSVTDELTKLGEGAGADDMVGRLTDLNREYLRKLTELPTVAVKQFNEELERIHGRGTRSAAPPRKRAAKAKP